MKAIIACEFSGRVRDAFRARGHDAWSCDLLPCDPVSPYHFEGSIEWVLNKWPDWDLLIGHPPCTYLSNSGVLRLYKDGKRWLRDKDGNVIGENPRDPQRWAQMEAGAKFFKFLLKLSTVPLIAIENPIMHGHAAAIIGQSFTQTIQPWEFGHPESKATCLWLKNLPALKPTKILSPPKLSDKGRPIWDNQTPSGQNKLGPSADRWAKRSITYVGIANAMAEQWGNVQPQLL